MNIYIWTCISFEEQFPDMSVAVYDIRNETVSNMDVSLLESGGEEIFYAQSATFMRNSVLEFQNLMRIKLPSTAFQATSGRIDVKVLQRSANKAALAGWIGTALDIMNRFMTQIKAVAELEARISNVKEANRDFLRDKFKDQQAVIDLQEKSLKK